MPPVLERPQVRRSTHYRKRTWWRRLALIVMRLAVVVAMFGIIGAGYYLARRWFGRDGATASSRSYTSAASKQI